MRGFSPRASSPMMLVPENDLSSEMAIDTLTSRISKLTAELEAAKQACHLTEQALEQRSLECLNLKKHISQIESSSAGSGSSVSPSASAMASPSPVRAVSPIEALTRTVSPPAAGSEHHQQLVQSCRRSCASPKSVEQRWLPRLPSCKPISHPRLPPMRPLPHLLQRPVRSLISATASHHEALIKPR